MDKRSFRISMFAALLAVLAAAHAGDEAVTTTADAFAPVRQGLRWVTQLVRVPAPQPPTPVSVITTGVRG